MNIYKVTDNKKAYMNFLMIADEQESMIDKYLDRGTMFVLDDDGAVAECVVTDEGNGVLEIKNIAVIPERHKMGYGKALINFIEHEYGQCFHTLRVGTGESPLTIPFYHKCGFTESFRIKNFFTDNYDHPIFECGIQLIDMIYLEKAIAVNRK